MRVPGAVIGVQSLVLLALAGAHDVTAAADATAILRVSTNPDFNRGKLRFSGMPGGEIDLSKGTADELRAEGLTAGSHISTLAAVDPELTAAGYVLKEIRCDDRGGTPRSSGDVAQKKAVFALDGGETVTCEFVFSAGSCVCPKEGKWTVTNHPGTMVCTGAMTMSVPLQPSTGSGTLETRDGCATVVAKGVAEDEATLEMHATDGCAYRGSVGGSQDGIPMTIEFTWNVADDERVTGNLKSSVSQRGMTCNMSRTYELRFSGS